ncbi:hypothetical protein HY629_00405, partial [Candidatus Uhrbacteria bacterium]|nr:hypothetical protein [Candidatus Uhrbacteria bacterium]
MSDALVPTVIVDEREERAALRIYDGAFPARIRDMPTRDLFLARARSVVRPEPEVKRARENKPFGDLEARTKPYVDAMQRAPSQVADAFARRCEDFLQARYPMLREDHIGFPVSFSMDVQANDAEVAAMVALKAKHNELGLRDQAARELPRIYSEFNGARRVLRGLREKGLLLPTYILPDEVLPWFTVTAPVWYVSGAAATTWGGDRTFLDYMVKRLGTERLAIWFQMWNYRSRRFESYEGDAIPANLLQVIGDVKPLLDFVAIATPYHDVALQQWQSVRWTRMVDPYLIGFSQHIPNAFFFLGRWSNTGMFPLAAEMIAHTMAFLGKHRGLFERIEHAEMTVPGDGGLYP